jgi:hypothetical protein
MIVHTRTLNKRVKKANCKNEFLKMPICDLSQLVIQVEN